jgi:hypothetical protein
MRHLRPVWVAGSELSPRIPWPCIGDRVRCGCFRGEDRDCLAYTRGDVASAACGAPMRHVRGLTLQIDKASDASDIATSDLIKPTRGSPSVMPTAKFLRMQMRHYMFHNGLEPSASAITNLPQHAATYGSDLSRSPRSGCKG